MQYYPKLCSLLLLVALFAAGLGDITDDDANWEWKGAVKFIKKLDGKVPYSLIRGNHDKRSEVYEKCFHEVADYKDMTVMADGVKCRLILCHYFIPFYNGVRHMAFMLHGHTHKTEESVLEERIKEDLRRKGLRCEAYNVGAMWQDYEPQTFEEIIARQGRTIHLI